MRRLRILVVSAFLSCLTLAGCGGRPDGVLLPVQGTEASNPRVDILVATTRSDVGATPGQMFTGERGEKLAFADISVSIPAAHKEGEVEWPAGKADPKVHFTTLRADRVELKQALRRFHDRTTKTPQKRVLVFVHGYNTRFEEAVYRFAQIVHDAGAPVVPILFTWPSRGRLLSYNYDRESANFSRDSLEALLRAVASDPAVGEVAVLAHSMGNWVTMEALRQIALRDRRMPGKLKTVMLAAPDVDVDVFRRQIAVLPGHGSSPRFTLFVAQDDSALAVSTQIWGGKPRLGAIDPSQEPYRTQLQEARVQVIDLTKVSSSDPLGHGRFAQSPEVVAMIGRRLAAGQTLSDGQAGLADRLTGIVMGATGAVGSAASLVVTAPLAIVDGKSRDTLGDHVEVLKESSGRIVQAR